jgi:hypothetical protein
MWKRELNGRKYLRNYGFVLRPREVSEPRLQGQYEELRKPAPRISHVVMAVE